MPSPASAPDVEPVRVAAIGAGVRIRPGVDARLRIHVSTETVPMPVEQLHQARLGAGGAFLQAANRSQGLAGHRLSGAKELDRRLDAWPEGLTSAERGFDAVEIVRLERIRGRVTPFRPRQQRLLEHRLRRGAGSCRRWLCSDRPVQRGHAAPCSEAICWVSQFPCDWTWVIMVSICVYWRRSP